MINIRLRELMDSRHITRNNLARICYVLDCIPADRIEYTRH